MNRNRRTVQVLACIGLIAGLVAIISIVANGDTFGLPGSAAYRAYELFNRVVALLIALEASALVALYLQERASLPRPDRALLLIALVAWIGMAAGTAAEFWLFSDLPYSEANMRSVSFSVFSLSSLISGLALLVLGIRTLIGRQLSRGLGVVLILYLPADVLFFAAGESIFLAAALITIVIAGFILVWPVASQKAA